VLKFDYNFKNHVSTTSPNSSQPNNGVSDFFPAFSMAARIAFFCIFVIGPGFLFFLSFATQN